MARFVMALDQGTTSSRAILFDAEGGVVATDRYEFPQHFRHPGWVEHDPEEIWDSQLRAARGVLEKAGATGNDIAAIGITNQRETSLVWERASGTPIHPAIVWQSRQSADICERLRAEGERLTVAVVEDLRRQVEGLKSQLGKRSAKVRALSG